MFFGSVYKKDSGEIVGQIFGESAAVLSVPDAFGLLPGIFSVEEFYVLDGAATPRLLITPNVSAVTIAADGVAECNITSLPDPCQAQITGAVTSGPASITGGKLTITSTQPGAIRVAVTAGVQRKLWEALIHAF